MQQSVANKAYVAAYVRVAIPSALPSMLDYIWQAPHAPKIGDFVNAPVGARHVHGVVAEVLTSSPYQNLKTATPLEGVPPLAPQTMAFQRWVARYTLSAPGEPLRAGLPKGQVPTLSKRKKKNVDEGVIPAKAGIHESVKLNSAQQHAVTAVSQKLNTFAPFLLDGVTGSGKTEVYFELIAQLLAKDDSGQVVVTVPEIGLTPQWLQRFAARFGFEPTLWHAEIAEGARKQAWWDVHTGKARVVVGARSALFLPFQNLKLLVVDEEHDTSYKQDDGFRYHGRDMAVALASHWQCPILLASATPSLETWHNATTGKYTHLLLPERHGKFTLPTLQLIDLTQQEKPQKNKGTGAPKAFIAPALKQAVLEAVGRGEQALLFLNRRGNAPVLVCTGCGYRRDCPSCSATPTVHGEKLLCHYCGQNEPWPEHCPQCNETGTWLAYGPGTRKLVQEVQAMGIPMERIALADSDAVDSMATRDALIEQILAHKVDVLIGTQMLAKGHHFPALTLVGVVDGDMGLTHGDVRAAEKTFQLLTQVAGRAGREKAGKVLVQTHQPEHPLFQALKTHNRNGFYAAELAHRKDWGDPPYGRQVAIILAGKDEAQVQAAAQTLAQAVPRAAWEKVGVSALGPAPAAMAKIRDKYRYRLLVKGNVALQPLVKVWVESVQLPPAVRVTVDVDPQSYF
ncbi:MAG: primosomal protein N' [Alphaproteobacteria bacterium]